MGKKEVEEESPALPAWLPDDVTGSNIVATVMIYYHNLFYSGSIVVGKSN